MQTYKGKTILNITETAEYLGLQKSSIRTIIQNKEINHFRNSKKLVFFKIEDLDNWMTQNPVTK